MRLLFRFRFLSPFLLAALAGIPFTARTEEGDDAKMKIFILAGQSNMAGNGVPSELPAEYRKHPDNVFMPIPPRDRGRHPRTDLVPFAPFPERFGPEVGFAHAMAEAWPNEKIVIVKKAIGGTSALAWSPEWTEEGAALTENHRNGPLYTNLMEQMVTPLLERYKNAEVVGILWAQGGRDGRYEQAAADYEENLTRIIEAFRGNLGNPALPFVLAHTVDAPARNFPYIEVVRSAQQRVAASVPKTALVPIDGLSRKSDRTHFDTAGQLELGSRFAKAYLELTGEPAPRSR